MQAAGNISVYEMGKVHTEKRKGFFSFLVLIQEAGKVVLLQCVPEKFKSYTAVYSGQLARMLNFEVGF